MIKHRIRGQLEDAINKGKRQFYLYGNGIKDKFYENMYDGIIDMEKSVLFYFLERADCNNVALINNRTVTVFHNQLNGLYDVSSQYIMEEKMKDDMEDASDEQLEQLEENLRTKSKEAINIQREIEATGSNIINYAYNLKKKIVQEANEENKFAVFFEDFEWLANLYSTNNEKTLEYIRLVKEFILVDNCYMIMSIENIELLKMYGFDMEGANVLYVGNPSSKEIQVAFLREYMKKSNNEIQENLLSVLEDIGYALSASKKSLREALHIFEKIVFSGSCNRIDNTDFEVAIERITDEKVTLDDVIISTDEKDKIIAAVDAFLKGENSADRRKGLILAGPPGTGKTHIVRALANDRNCYFLAPKLSELKGEFVGQTSGKVRRIFDEARANERTILFIDEADTVFPARDVGINGGDSYTIDMVNQFLQEIDGLKNSKQKVFVIAATNRPEMIDSAIQSRLSERIYIGLPDADNRIKIFDSKLKRYNFVLSKQPYKEEIVEKTVNMSGRDIENYVKILNEYITSGNTKFDSMDELAESRDYESVKNTLLEVLEINERTLIADLQKKVPIEVVENTKIDFSDIIGYEDIKKKITRQVEYISADSTKKKKISDYGIKLNRGMLLYGPPGNAKTKLAESIATQFNFYFVKVLSKDFVSDSIAQQLDNIQIIFDQVTLLSKMCNKHDGVVLFFDEFDALAGNRLNPVVRGTLLDLLASGEDNESRLGIRASRVFLVAATNDYSSLDEAVIRKGRIDEHVLLDNPTEQDGKKMLMACFEKDNEKKLVEIPDSNIIAKIYDNLLDLEIKNSNAKQTRPSGATIINTYEGIKAETFFVNEELLGDNKALNVTEEIVSAYFSSIASSCASN